MTGDQAEPARYEIRVDGVLDDQWADWLGGLQLEITGGQTTITGVLPDQPALHGVLARSGLSIDEIGAFEVNEAFAPVPLAWLADLGADPKALNANGGAIALGHPLGGSGARLMTTLVHHMRDNGIRYGLQTMCEGGGQANATILELL